MRLTSPYINRFLQPDSIIPSPANPQSMNRFGYVGNNPINFNDPTGHVCSDPEDPTPTCYGSSVVQTKVGDRMIHGNDAELGKAKTKSSENPFFKLQPIPENLCPYISCYNGSPQGPVPDGFCPAEQTLVECYESGLPMYMGEDPILIDPTEFNDLLSAISDTAYQSNSLALFLDATGFDTQFYDRSVYGATKLPGIGCLNGKCYARHELNYIAQGVLWARLGFSKGDTHFNVWLWKLSPVMHFPTTPSPGTIEMTDIGYDAYNKIYPPTPPAPHQRPLWP